MAFMFSALDEKEKEIVVDAMEEAKVDVNDVVIKEGDQGDCLYVVGTGTLSCTKIFPGNTDPTFLKSYTPGEAFGELALLYNAPRAATITAIESCTLFRLDRDTFNHIVKDSAQRKREKYEEFLAKVPILSTMEPYERTSLADAFREIRVTAGEKVITEGEPGNDLFLLQEGEAVATKTLQAGQAPQQVMAYKMGDFFGERALLKNEPRAANIVASTDCLLVAMDRHSVKRLLGPLETVLKRNFDLYEKYAAQQ
jgi:cAMP-dependent protein kinase regulator